VGANEALLDRRRLTDRPGRGKSTATGPFEREGERWHDRFMRSGVGSGALPYTSQVALGTLGGVAEWLGRGLQNLVQRFNSAPRLQARGVHYRTGRRDDERRERASDPDMKIAVLVPSISPTERGVAARGTSLALDRLPPEHGPLGTIGHEQQCPSPPPAMRSVA
jgi:hypothetical protein